MIYQLIQGTYNSINFSVSSKEISFNVGFSISPLISIRFSYLSRYLVNNSVLRLKNV